MLKTSSHTPSGRVLGLLLLAAIALGAAPAAADETYVVDQSAGTGGLGALFRVDATTGNRSLVSDFGNAAQGPVGVDPLGLALEAGGTILVADASVGTGALGALFRVNATSGARSLISDFANAAQGPLGHDPEALTLEASGAVLVIDPSAGTGNDGALFRVDTASGNRSLVSDFGNPAQGPLGADQEGLALEARGAVLVIDFTMGTGGLGLLFRVDAITGNRSLVSDFGDPAQGPLGRDPIGLAVEASGTVLVLDFEAGTGNAGALFRMDATTGNRSLVSDFGDVAQGPLGDDPFGLALEAGGAVLVTDASAGTGNDGALFRVDRLSGQRTMLSDFGNAGQGDLGADPYRVAVVVPNCDGRVPTIVGDNGNNVLVGSPRADVIRGRGGADLIAGRGGNDRICGGDGNDALSGGDGRDRLFGGAGRDRLFGGPGRDRLFGSPGRDALDGGTGRDRCDGGAGTDTARRCEVRVRD